MSPTEPLPSHSARSAPGRATVDPVSTDPAPPADDFASTVASTTSRRGKDYGTRLGHFGCCGAMMSIWRQTRAQYLREGRVEQLPDDLEFALEHCVHIICDKLARAAASPLKRDHWVDIAGYADCFTGACEEAAVEME